MAVLAGAMSAMLLLVAALVTTVPPPETGGSVTSVPPLPSEVTMKFPDVYEPTRVRVAELRPLLDGQRAAGGGPGGLLRPRRGARA